MVTRQKRCSLKVLTPSSFFWEGKNHFLKNDKGALQLVHVVIAMGYLSGNLHNSKDPNLLPFITVADHSEFSHGQRTVFL